MGWIVRRRARRTQKEDSVSTVSITPCETHEQITRWQNQNDAARVARVCADCWVEEATA